jgi:hypothetical protein
MASVDSVPRLTLEQLTNKKFYMEYLTNSVPVLVEDGCSSWPAITKWKDMEYLSEEFGG